MFLLFTLPVGDTGPVRENALLDDCLRRMAQSDQSALETLYQHTRTSIYAYALSMLKNSHDAEDVLHDCLLQLWTAAPGYQSQGKPLAWILTVTRNLCLMKLREQKRTADIPSEDWEPYLAARQELSHEDRVAIAACMRHLSDEERQIVVLHAVAGFKHREIASLSDLPLSTVLSKYHRAIGKLRKQLEGV